MKVDTCATFSAFVKERYSDGLWEKAADAMAAYATSGPAPKTTKPGVTALYCPHCGAPFTLEAASRLHTCTYCKTTSALTLP